MPETHEIRDTPEMVDVLVTRAAPFWLPAMSERDPVTKEKIRSICGSLMLKPGANRITRKRWNQALEHPTVKLHASDEVGTLRVEPDAAEVAKHTHAPDPMTGLDGLTVAKATPWIEASEDAAQLAKWRTGEVKGKNRAGILELIDRRVDALSEASEE